MKKLRKFQKLLFPILSISTMSTMVFSMPVSANDLEGKKETQSVKEELIEQKDTLGVEEKITEQKETQSVEETTEQKETQSVEESTKPASEPMSFINMLRTAPNETITVRRVDDANNILDENITLKVGKIADNVQQTFKKMEKHIDIKKQKV